MALYVDMSFMQPKMVVSANCGVEPNRLVPYKPMLDAALESSQFQPDVCLIFNRPQVTEILVFMAVFL